ncbi:hypothetical protein EV363DRAFT_1320164 [Boletus edulis]|uniref:Uncharacterized protein n=1 Tax=Boletus edulis BED1 TaxID=1328754 RepID=A0AAD4C3Z4_BOLED|nr:hypothetical protein EV363DRAFT_1320164 [Boletus edulis]KAF8447652.1 hypothetical protein L210DRAFT_3526902 [Boletus edulis BED1]
MYQQFSATAPPDYEHNTLMGSLSAGPSTVAPHATTTTPILHQKPPPLVATGDWAHELVQLAKTAELKKHSLTLQLHTAHVVSAHASLEQKDKAIQDLREQKNKLDSERIRLLNALAEINSDRDKADLLEASISRECAELRQHVAVLQDGEYAAAKSEVDRLRQELGQAPLPPLQATLDEKTSQYLRDRRVNGEKRSAGDVSLSQEAPSGTTKRPRGRPKGSKNRASRTGGNASGGA